MGSEMCIRDRPHPLMHERKFVMEPLAEIAPFVVHPVLKERIIDLKERL